MQSDWYVDTGASAHMTSSANTLDSFEPYTGTGRVIVGNGDALPISHFGSKFVNNNLPLLDVLVVPHITKNLLFISKLTLDLPVDVVFSNDSFVIQTWVKKEILAKGRCKDGLYVLEHGSPALLAALYSSVSKSSFELWHNRLGQISVSIIQLLNKLGHLAVTSVLPKPTVCSSC